MAQRKTIVLTGASGVVGRALLRELTDHRLIGLVHRSTLPEGVEQLRCDTTAERLGLDAAAYRELAREADLVLHAAAETDWAAPRERLERVNVGGTERVVQLARDAGAPLHHVSTSFIHALRPDAPIELPDGHLIVDYIRSKIAAEEVVRGCETPLTIYRPTNLIGDSRTGEIARNQMVQLVSELVCRGKVPLFPAYPGTLVDVIAQDTMAKAMAAAIAADDHGSEYWLTAGEDALTLERTLELCVEFAERIGQPVEPPRVVPFERIGELEDQVAALPPLSRAFFGRVADVSSGLYACGTFPSSLAELQERYALPEVDYEDAFERGLEFWARSKGLAPAAA